MFGDYDNMEYIANMNRVKKFFKDIGNLSIKENDGGYTRLAFSNQEHDVHKWLRNKLTNISCTTEEDSVGNVFGYYGHKKESMIAFGSHLDTVPHGGLYDGALGVIAGLECLNVFYENHLYNDVPLGLVCFTGEESNPLGGTFGSRSMAGLIDDNEAYREKLNDFNFTWKDVVLAKKAKQCFSSFLELHIEQGNVLETFNKKVGIPSAIAGMLRLSVDIHGKASHAGTTPMDLRNDALVQAALLVSVVNRIAKETSGDIVATVGELHVFPNVPSVVPGEVKLVVEIRGIDWESVQNAGEKIKEWVDSNIVADVNKLVEKLPHKLYSSLQNIEEHICIENHIPYLKMISGANHDSNAMSTLTKTAMLFVPSKNGVSHGPDEFTSWEDIQIGINVFIKTIINLCEIYIKNEKG